MQVEYAGSVSEKRQVMNQADILYFSGHGLHDTGELVGAGTAADIDPYWSSGDIDIAIFAGCSVLDIKDYNNNYTGEDHLSSPGEDWVHVGPDYFLGYNYTAPFDTQGSVGIISNWASSNGNPIERWRDSNDGPPGRNACVVTSLGNYYYFKKTTIFGQPINYSWTFVGESEWQE